MKFNNYKKKESCKSNNYNDKRNTGKSIFSRRLNSKGLWKMQGVTIKTNKFKIRITINK